MNTTARFLSIAAVAAFASFGAQADEADFECGECHIVSPLNNHKPCPCVATQPRPASVPPGLVSRGLYSQPMCPL